MIRLRDFKDRKLVQWLLAYLAGSWVLIQVADVIGARFDWPDAWMRILIVVLAVGAVVVLVLAWYHGEHGEQRVSTVELGMLTALLVIAGVAVQWVRPAATPSSAVEARSSILAAAPAASVAVLPFVNMSDSKENEYFADGITEEILSALGRSHRLRVISRTSVMQYKDSKKPLKQIAAELGVAAILEGSVRRQGSKVRITAQLIDARTDGHMWSENYDRGVEDIFAIQSDIAMHISESLEAALSPAERSGIMAGRTQDVGAYDLYLKGRTVADRGGADLKGLRTAAALYHEALEVDSTYALAYVGLAKVYAELRFYAGAAWQDSAYAAARKALDLAPLLAEAHATLGDVHWYAGRLVDAEGAYRAAIRIDPNNSPALRGMGLALNGRSELEEGLRWAFRATLVDPLDYTAQTLVGNIFYAADDNVRAERWFSRSLTTHANKNYTARGMLMFLYLRQGLPDRAEALLTQYRHEAPTGDQWIRAEIALLRGQYELATRLYEESDRAARQEQASDVNYPGFVQLAYLYMRAGNRSKADRVLREVEAAAHADLKQKDSASGHLQLARVCAVRGNRTCALEHLSAAAKGRWYRPTAIRNDVMLESLRGEAEFQSILRRVDARGAAMRERLAQIAP
jgi:TolB-like protein/Tfp pilus assembly protein PilF